MSPLAPRPIPKLEIKPGHSFFNQEIIDANDVLLAASEMRLDMGTGKRGLHEFPLDGPFQDMQELCGLA